MAIIIVSSIFLSGCRKAPLSATRFLLGAYCKITIPASQKNAKTALVKAFERIAEIDQKFDMMNEKSPLYAFNLKGTPILDKEIVALVAASFKVRDESYGDFDPTVCPLVFLWGFEGDKPSLPDSKDIKRSLTYIGPDKVIIRDQVISAAKKGAGLDLGGIVSGYAADEVVKVLKNMGIKSALVDTGGELFALGTNNGKKWRIGIKNPRGEDIIGVIEAQDEAISTTGDYEKYFIQDAIRYHHVLDPKTGYPARGLESVTIICPTTTEADGWSTAFFVLGVEKGFQVFKNKPGFKAITITEKGELISSKGVENILKFNAYK